MAGIKIKKETAPAVLHEGDTIEVGLSSEVKIDGDSNWISYKISTRVQTDETSEQAHERALNYLKTKFEQTVTSTVEMIQGMGN